MAVVQSVGALTELDIGWWASWWPRISYGSLQMYNKFNYDYATLYKQQPNVRTCVDFLARNIAQLGLHVFRRVSDTDRVRLTDHPLAQLLDHPLPADYKVTSYRLIESLMGDLGVYFNAYWLKVKTADGPMGLLRLPPALVYVYGNLIPTRYEVSFSGQLKEFAPSEIVHFRGYNAEDPITGLSPLETLRRVLAEEHSAGDYREHFWQNAARQAGIIERPKDAPEWSTTARERFKEEFEALYAGGDNSGKTAILEEGMTWRPGTFNAQESEYLAGRKLTREECARAYHIPLPMVGILDNATFSNIREQHRNLYQDSLGPWLAMIEQDIELQLMPEFGDIENVYVEFNIAEKLQGAFEEQTEALQSAVGRPWMTADEARSRMNLPSMGGDADRLVTPLNVMVGGQPSPNAPVPPKSRDVQDRDVPWNVSTKKAGEVDPTQPELRGQWRKRWTRHMVGVFERQREAVMKLAKAKALPDLAILWDSARWNSELTGDLRKLSTATAQDFARYVSEQLGTELDSSEMDAWLAENSRIMAENVNDTTRSQIQEGLRAEDPLDALRSVFELAVDVRAAEIATTRTTSLANFGTMNAARQGGLRTKTWHVNSANPRPSHAALSGATVGIRDLFANGLMWPGDPRGTAEDNANCSCSVTFGRSET